MKIKHTAAALTAALTFGAVTTTETATAAPPPPPPPTETTQQHPEQTSDTETTSGTTISWKLGSTHGLIFETTAVRASLGVYRVPRSLLYLVYRYKGINKVQDVLWHYGQAPYLKAPWWMYYLAPTYNIVIWAITASYNNIIHYLIYHDDADLKEALINAQSEYNCLAMTFLSYGLPRSNWTRKNTGCYLGSLDSLSTSSTSGAFTEPGIVPQDERFVSKRERYRGGPSETAWPKWAIDEFEQFKARQ